MKTWLDLETRFRNLVPKLKFYRLDEQTGAAGEFWRLAGGPSTQMTHEFEILATVAGNLLKERFSAHPDFNEVVNHNDAKIVWYRALKKFSNAHEPLNYAEQKNDDGTSAGFIFMGSIRNLEEVSANVCLDFETRYPIKQRLLKALWDDYAKEIIITLIAGVITGTILAVFHLS